MTKCKDGGKHSWERDIQHEDCWKFHCVDCGMKKEFDTISAIDLKEVE